MLQRALGGVPPKYSSSRAQGESDPPNLATWAIKWAKCAATTSANSLSMTIVPVLRTFLHELIVFLSLWGMNQSVYLAETAYRLFESAFWDRKAWNILSFPSLAGHFTMREECWMSLSRISGIPASHTKQFWWKTCKRTSPSARSYVFFFIEV